MELGPGQIIDGKYRIVNLLGTGGMGAVYRGENTRISRAVAIKVLHARAALTADAVTRFEREAQAAGRIGSEHIVQVLDMGNLPNGDRYMVMELLDGEPLSNRIRTLGKLSANELYPIALQLLEGLSAAHAAQIIHRDLKPDNVFLVRKGVGGDFVKLLDFGISKFNSLSGDAALSMTQTGAVMGTPYYMAPEQARGQKIIDHRVDIYATGVILYQALTGEVPFNGQTLNELLFKIALEEPVPLCQRVPELDAQLESIVSRAMARDPQQRFAGASEFRAALEQWAHGRSGGALYGTTQSRVTGVLSATAAPGHTVEVPTHDNWSNTTTHPKGSRARVLGLALGLVALLGVGGFGVHQLLQHRTETQLKAQTAEQARLAEQVEVERIAQAKQVAQKLEAAAAQAREQVASAEAAEKAEPSPAEVAATLAAAASASAAPSAVPPAQGPSGAGVNHGLPRPEPTGGGRRIRTKL